MCVCFSFSFSSAPNLRLLETNQLTTKNKGIKNNLEQWHFPQYQLNKHLNRHLHMLATFKRWDMDEKQPPFLKSISRKHSTDRGFVSKLHRAVVPSLHAEDGRYFSKGVEYGKLKLGRSCNWKRTWRATKRASYRYIGSKRKTREDVGLLQNWAIDLVIKVKEKAEMLKASFTLAITGNKPFHVSQASVAGSRVWGRARLPTVE